MSDKPIRVAVTGAGGQIAYSLLPRIANGDVFGRGRKVILQLIEVTPALGALQGVAMELHDCAPPDLLEVICTDDAEKGFGDADAVFLVGGKPRGPGMQRADLIRENGPIFKGQGAGIGRFASRNVKVLVVANPCNTNCLVTAANAKGIKPEQFHAMTRLDHNRGVTQLALKAGKTIASVKKMLIWGNHSDTQVPDTAYASVDGKAVSGMIDEGWLRGDFVKTVATRGKAIIDARGKSSAASAAHAAIDHMRDWFGSTPDGDFTSMAIWSNGKHYSIPEGLYCSLPVTVKNGVVSVVEGLKVTDWAKGKLEASIKELQEERDTVKDLLK